MSERYRHPRVSDDPDVCRAYDRDASGMVHTPEAVARPETEGEVQELLRLSAAHGMPLTPQGLRSSTTGASVVERGVALSLERLARVVSIDTEARTVVAEPGIVLGDLKREIRAAGLFYPPDPTSENECSLGGTVALNASGSRTYAYGPTRGWVRALRVVLANGEVLSLRRRNLQKNTAGYFPLHDSVDLWIGSEGTLGVVTEVELQCLALPVGDFGALAFFPDWTAAIRFVLEADRRRREGRLHPRCLELFDRNSLLEVRDGARGGTIPPASGAAIYFEEEVSPERQDDAFERWCALTEEMGGSVEDTVVARTEAEKAELRRLRHAIPAGMNERGARALAAGGRKISTDCAVPLSELPVFMERAYRISGELFGGLTAGYGHVGNGHPHFNLVAEDAEALVRAERAAREIARVALELGGTLAAEHGIGKLKRLLFRELYPAWQVEAMAALKRSLDPMGLLSPGNLFD